MKKIFFILAVLFALSCKKGSSGTDNNIILVSPAKGELCTTGEILSSTESRVTFRFNPVDGAHDYKISYTDLQRKTTATVVVNGSNSHQAVLLRNTPYSWQISAIGDKGQSLVSETWSFHNATVGDTFFAPYAAELISPKKDAVLASGVSTVSLTWNGSDEDGDIDGYDVYFGKTTSPALLKSTKENSVTGISVDAASTYYWKIITKDKKGNVSYSGVSTFRTN